MEATELAERLLERFADAPVARGEVTVVVARDDLHRALGYLRDQDDLAFDVLADLTATDWPDREPRFWIAYELYSMRHRHRLRESITLFVRHHQRLAHVLLRLFCWSCWRCRQAL